MKAGSVAGTIRKNGTITVRASGKVYLASRVIWAIYHGYWPNLIVDHIDGNPGNNRISNLRLATSQQNQWNRKVHKNLSGHKGITRCQKASKWIAQLRHEGKNFVVGRYDNLDDAVAAYERKAVEMRGEWHRQNQVYTG